jgi:hypothetical protein
MQALREEIDQLKRLISKPHFTPKIQNISDSAGFNEAPDTNSQVPIETIFTELSDPRGRSPRGYYNRHTLLEFFTEVSLHSLPPIIIAHIYTRFHNYSHSSKKLLMSGSNLEVSTSERTSLRRWIHIQSQIDNPPSRAYFLPKMTPMS